MSGLAHHGAVQQQAAIAGADVPDDAISGPTAHRAEPATDDRGDRRERIIAGISSYENTILTVQTVLSLLWIGGTLVVSGYGFATKDAGTAFVYGLAAGLLGAIAIGLAMTLAKACLSPWAFALRLRARRLIDHLLPHPGLCRRWLWDAPWPNAIAIAVPEKRLLVTGHMTHFEIVSIRAERIIEVEVRMKTEREIVTKHSGTSIIALSRSFAFTTGSSSRTTETQRDYAWLDIRYRSPTSFEPVRLTIPFGEDVSAAGDFRAAIQMMRYD